MSRVVTILLGLVLIVVLTPLSHFLTMSTVSADIEVASPIGWAVGLVFSFVLVLAAVRALARLRLVSARNVVLLYVMLTIAVPVMNIGLARQCFLSLASALHEHMFGGNNTYRTAYAAQGPAWFPVVPTPEGLAWNKADRLLRLLGDDDAEKRRDAAQRDVAAAIMLEARRLARDPGAARADAAPVLARVDALGVDEIVAILALKQDPAIDSLGLRPALQARLDAAAAAGRGAAAALREELKPFDEFAAALLPANRGRLDRSSEERLARELRRLPAAERAALDAQTARLAEREAELRSLVSRLSEADFAAVRAALRDHALAVYSRMPDDQYRRARAGFVYRLRRQDRRALTRQDGAEGTPNQNAAGFFTSLWEDVAAKKAKTDLPLRENLRTLFDRLPWHVWLRPMINWSVLFLVVFLLLMCMAEWLRRKWVDRENLAFPVVEVADNIIRHDCDLEAADDIRAPRARRWLFNPVFVIGLLLGILLISMEAAGHYGLAKKPHVLFFDVSGTLFSSGAAKLISRCRFVLSPIVVGLCFLVSLEVSFSIWVTYWIYEVVVMVVRMVNPEIKDSLYTGWAEDRIFPFATEQMVGACLCFALVLVIKTRQSRRAGDGRAGAAAAPEAAPYVPPLLCRAGLVLLPLAALALMWSMGVHNLPLLLASAAICLAVTIVGARLRAETGLHTHHVTYEFTKLPMLFGLTGLTGAEVFSLFINVAFLPLTLLFRALPQQLENLELARRHRIGYGTVAVASLFSFVVALAAGMLCVLLFAYYHGEAAYGSVVLNPKVTPTAFALARYPLWVSHFLGENGLDKFTQPHWIRIWFIAIGFAVCGLLLFLRGRFLGFKLHPIGYLLVLTSAFYSWLSPYTRGVGGPASDKLSATSVLWGSALVAWLLKRAIVKYGGMNTYRRAKPLFVGLVAGSVFAVFGWNVMDLVCSIMGSNNPDPGNFIKLFSDVIPYSPSVY